MPLIIIAAGVALLLILMIGFKVNGFIALVLVAAVVGFAEGMDAQAVLHSIQNGIGSTLGGLAMILGFGAMLGKLISDTGAAQRIATTLIATFGKKRVQWALVITGLVVGLAMFFEVGFVLLLPLVFTIVASSGLPLLYVGVPMVAALCGRRKGVVFPSGREARDHLYAVRLCENKERQRKRPGGLSGGG